MDRTDLTTLIVEDDLELANLITPELSACGLTVRHVTTISHALHVLHTTEVQVVIVDRNLPDGDGLEVCRFLQNRKLPTASIILSCLGDAAQRVHGLDVGADDYLPKPFVMSELLARVRSLLRRKAACSISSSPAKLERRDLTINREERLAWLSGKLLSLTPTEFDLLLFLAENPGKPFSRNELLCSVWGYTMEDYEHTVNSHIARLRSKLGDHPSRPSYILTVWGVGYRFAPLDSD